MHADWKDSRRLSCRILGLILLADIPVRCAGQTKYHGKACEYDDQPEGNEDHVAFFQKSVLAHSGRSETDVIKPTGMSPMAAKMSEAAAVAGSGSVKEAAERVVEAEDAAAMVTSEHLKATTQMNQALESAKSTLAKEAPAIQAAAKRSRELLVPLRKKAEEQQAKLWDAQQRRARDVLAAKDAESQATEVQKNATDEDRAHVQRLKVAQDRLDAAILVVADANRSVALEEAAHQAARKQAEQKLTAAQRAIFESIVRREAAVQEVEALQRSAQAANEALDAVAKQATEEQTKHAAASKEAEETVEAVSRNLTEEAAKFDKASKLAAAKVAASRSLLDAVAKHAAERAVWQDNN
eukprot:gnl/TRDRNA2_/TRDRNA2_183950_c0_seq1.p1 gnl/TRDRNA2_/TRDRNA2_183950_c0~~gnl/TRDRNA2_/TRDRNA2_183950_c0_seq1.p1  ORF type:complete len:354 (+),score=89.56 gnl/TRDRNA2_/TRDRNA2_183950_c0_seq1:61-1122(+)